MYTYEWSRPIVCVDAIIKIAGKTLLIKRGEEPEIGMYAFPGGHVEENENSINACIREVKEETGLIVTKDNSLLVGVFDDEWRDPRRQWCISIVYCFDSYIGIAAAGDDATDCEWIDDEDIRSGKIKLAFDHKSMWDKLWKN